MMEQRIHLTSGDEHDAFSRRWRRYVGWKAGTIKAIKNGYRRRIRRMERKDIATRLEDA